MTNKEYIEKNNISFSDAMKMWDNKTSCINDWLNQERQEHKLKVGDFVRYKNGIAYSNTKIGVVIKIPHDRPGVYLRFLNRDGKLLSWDRRLFDGFHDVYLMSDNTIFYEYDRNCLEKKFLKNNAQEISHQICVENHPLGCDS